MIVCRAHQALVVVSTDQAGRPVPPGTVPRVWQIAAGAIRQSAATREPWARPKDIKGAMYSGRQETPTDPYCEKDDPLVFAGRYVLAPASEAGG